MPLLTELVARFRRDRARLQRNWVQRLIDGRPAAEAVRAALSESAAGLYEHYLNALETGDVRSLRARAREVADQVGPRGVKPQEVLEIVLLLRDVLARDVLRTHATEPGTLTATLDAFEPAATRVATRLGLGFCRQHRQDVPPVGERMLVLSVQGVVDGDRARHVAERLLVGIRASRARGVVLDMTSATSVDGVAAAHLLQAARAARLLGSTVMLAGVSPQIAVALDPAARPAFAAPIDGTGLNGTAVHETVGPDEDGRTSSRRPGRTE